MTWGPFKEENSKQQNKAGWSFTRHYCLLKIIRLTLITLICIIISCVFCPLFLLSPQPSCHRESNSVTYLDLGMVRLEKSSL